MDIGCFHLNVSEGSESSLLKLPSSFHYKTLCQLFMPLPSSRVKVYMLGICLKQLLFFFNFQLKQYSCFWIKMKKAVCCFAHNKKLSTFASFGSAHPATGNTNQSFGSYWHNNTTFCHLHKNQPKFSYFTSFGEKTFSWLCYKNKDSGSFSWRVALSILRPKCKVLLTTVNSPVLHTTKQAGAWHWIKHLSLTSLGSDCFSIARCPSVILTRLNVKTNKKRKEQKPSSLINLKIQKVLHQFLKIGISHIQLQQNLPCEEHSRPYFHLEQQNEYFN